MISFLIQHPTKRTCIFWDNKNNSVSHFSADAQPAHFSADTQINQSTNENEDSCNLLPWLNFFVRAIKNLLNVIGY